MKICLDARGNHFGGVYTYTVSLLRTLPLADPEFDFLVLLDERQVKEGRLTKYVPYRSVPVLSPLKMVWWNNVTLPNVLEEENIDLYHGFKHFGIRHPNGHKCKMIWTLHSASWWLYPELFSVQERMFWSRYYTLGARRLDRVVCVSHADKKSFVESIGLNPEKVSVTQLASDSRFTRVEDQVMLQQVSNKYSLPEKYIVFVGTIYPFKNIETIVKVFASALKSDDMSQDLVIVGGISPAYGEDYRSSLIKLSKEKGVYDRIHWTGSVFDELPAIYSMADAMLFPSYFESFGLPLLEAMACEVPLVASNAACLPEVIGDAGLMRDPNDIEGLTEDLLEILGNDSLRNQLIQKGLERVKYFSWERCAMDTIKVYRDMLSMPPVVE